MIRLSAQRGPEIRTTMRPTSEMILRARNHFNQNWQPIRQQASDNSHVNKWFYLDTFGNHDEVKKITAYIGIQSTPLNRSVMELPNHIHED
jgi:hypothetical protein